MSTNTSDEIKTMKLYTDLDRIANELKEEGYSLTEGDVPSKVVHKLTMLSYSGEQGCKDVIERAGLTSEGKVLDLGSGLGGPARVVSDLSGASVTALEYQADLTGLCNQLNMRSGFDKRVKAVTGDACSTELPGQLAALEGAHSPPYDAAVSWLMILHIKFEDRRQLWANLASSLRQGAVIFVEDFYATADDAFTAEQVQMLEKDVAIPDGKLPTRAAYEEQVKGAGFVDLEWQDMTETWTSFVSTRHDAYVAAEERHRRVHQGPTFDHMNHFYTSVRSLFASGSLKGVRLIAKRG